MASQLEVYREFAKSVNHMVNGKQAHHMPDSRKIEYIKELLIVLDERWGD